MCVHDISVCADCPTEEQQESARQAAVAAWERAFARAATAPAAPAPIPVTIVPVPSTSRYDLESDRPYSQGWDGRIHRMGTNPYPSRVPVQHRPPVTPAPVTPVPVSDLFARLAQARPEWVPNV